MLEEVALLLRKTFDGCCVLKDAHALALFWANKGQYILNFFLDPLPSGGFTELIPFIMNALSFYSPEAPFLRLFCLVKMLTVNFFLLKN